MRTNNTRNLIQVEGGENIKQADKGSYLAYQLVDTNRNPAHETSDRTAEIVVYDRYNNRKWSTTTTVKSAKVRFKLPGNLEVGSYDLDVTVDNMVFPSDRRTKIQVVEGSLSSMRQATEAMIDMTNYPTKADLATKVDKVSGKGLSTNDYSNTDKAKVNGIPSNPKYTDTTYTAGNGLALNGNSFSVDDTVAKKTDIPSLAPYARTADLVVYEKTTSVDSKLANKVDKVSGKGLSTNDYTDAARAKVDAIPTDPKYTDTNTTYKAGTGLSLSGTTFNIDSSIARKADIPSLDDYAKLSDIPNIDTALGKIDLTNYATKNDLTAKVDKVSGKVLSTNDYTTADKNKVAAIPASPKYTDTTYMAGNGLALTGTTFAVDDTIARKSDIPSVDSLTGNIDLADYVTKADLSKLNINSDRLKQLDTRRDDSPPSHYIDKYNQSIITEFKYTNVVGVKDILTGAYCNVTTITPWRDPSGGLPVQIATSNTNNGTVVVRAAKDANTWGEWTPMGGSGAGVDLSEYVKAKDIHTPRVYSSHSDLFEGTDSKADARPGDFYISMFGDLYTFIEKDGKLEQKMLVEVSNKVVEDDDKGLSSNDFTHAYKNILDKIPSDPKYTDTTYKAGTGLSLSGTTFSVDDSVAKKDDLPKLDEYAKLDMIPNNRAMIYDNDSIDYEKAEVGKDWFLRNDGLMGPISSIDREAKSLRFSTRFTLNYPFARKKDIPGPAIHDLKKFDSDNAKVGDWAFTTDRKQLGIIKNINRLNIESSDIDTKLYFSVPIMLLNDMYSYARTRPALYTFMDYDFNIKDYLKYNSLVRLNSSYHPEDDIYQVVRESYYLSKEGYLAKVKYYDPEIKTGYKDYRPSSKYIKLNVTEFN